MIKTEDLYFSYTGSPPYVLQGVNLEVDDGEYVSVVGENGCGKSTLMRLILKFMKPTRGTVLTQTSRIGYVPQKRDVAAQGFPITVYEMMDSYRRLLKLRDKNVIERTLEQAGLSGLTRSLMGTLSGGQSQRALIARALMGSPDLLILDEPSSGVDPDSQRDIYGLIKQLNQQTGMTIVSVEHNLDAAVSHSTLIYHLSGGRGHICSPEKYAREYLGIGRKDDDIA